MRLCFCLVDLPHCSSEKVELRKELPQRHVLGHRPGFPTAVTYHVSMFVANNEITAEERTVAIDRNSMMEDPMCCALLSL